MSAVAAQRQPGHDHTSGCRSGSGGELDQARAADPAFIGSDDTARSIWDTASRYPIIDGMDFSHPAMCEARRAWHEALGTTPGEAEAIELLATLQCKPIRDRILVDAISATEDPGTYRQVMIGQFGGQPNWSRVDATEDLLTHLLTYAPGTARTPVFCFLGWLNWYKGRSSTALAYIAKGLETDPENRLAQLLLERTEKHRPRRTGSVVDIERRQPAVGKLN